MLIHTICMFANHCESMRIIGQTALISDFITGIILANASYYFVGAILVKIIFLVVGAILG